MKNNVSSLPEKIQTSFVDQIMYCSQGSLDQAIRIVISFADMLDENLLKEAFELSFNADPILNYLYLETNRKSYWVRNDSVNIDDIFKLELIDGNLEEAIHSFLVEKIDILSSPPVRIGILRHKELDTLIVKIHHSVADAAGLINYVRLLGSIYSGLKTDINYSIPPAELKGRDLDWKNITGSYKFFKKFKLIFDPETSKIIKKLRFIDYVFPWSNHEKDTLNIVSHKIKTGNTKKVISKCRAQKCTMDDIILTAYFMAFFKIIKKENLIDKFIYITLDMRNYSTKRKIENLTNLSFAEVVRLSDDDLSDFGQTLKKIIAEKQKYKLGFNNIDNKKIPAISSILMVSTLSKLLPYKKYKKAITDGKNLEVIPILSNVGILDSYDISFPDVPIQDMYIVGTISKKPGLTLAVSGYQRSLNLIVGYQGSKKDISVIKNLLEQIEKEMVE